jgi:hypothetical protein
MAKGERNLAACAVVGLPARKRRQAENMASGISIEMNTRPVTFRLDILCAVVDRELALCGSCEQVSLHAAEPEAGKAGNDPVDPVIVRPDNAARILLAPAAEQRAPMDVPVANRSAAGATLIVEDRATSAPGASSKRSDRAEKIEFARSTSISSAIANPVGSTAASCILLGSLTCGMPLKLR